MKKVFITLFVVTFLLVITMPVYAAPIPNPIADAFKSIPAAISTISSWIQPAAVLVYLVMLIYAGFLRLTAGADPEKAKKAFSIIAYSTTGFILIMLAPIVISTIGAIFNVGPLFGI